ncbi:unnamed protein product [Schistosoma curassoni]|uniref:Uncharacterized protein n=1 Tax=Schistosoma curassoni TaxID=6186 RepID=A0A183JDS0_9TREM|nr:unnamed protein product [Schistosoma curassoni]
MGKYDANYCTVAFSDLSFLMLVIWKDSAKFDHSECPVNQ